MVYVWVSNTVIANIDGHVTLDRLSGSDQYDFAQIYNKYITNDDDNAAESAAMDIDNCKYYSPDQFTELSQDNNDTMSIFCVNCQSINAHWDGLSDLLCELNSESHKFDFIGLTEIFKIHEHTNYTIEGYHPILYKCRPESEISRGGVALYINENLNYSIRDDLSVFIPHVYESIFVEIQMCMNKSFIVGVVYRPPTPPHANLDLFSQSFINIVNTINDEHKKLLVAGDFNIDMLKFQNHPKTHSFVEEIFTLGLTPLITRPTRVTTHSATLIDHIYTNLNYLNTTSGIIISDIADHFGIFALLYKQPQKQETRSVTFRSFKPERVCHFNELLANTDFSQISEIPCANQAYDTFLKIYREIYDRAFPLKQLKYSRKLNKHDPWISEGIRKSSKTKHKLLVKKLTNPSNLNIDKYKAFSKIFTKVKRNAKIIYYREAFLNKQNDIKGTWNIIRTLISNKSNNSILPTQFSLNNSDINDPQLIANEFNTFFTNIGHKTSQSVAPSNHNAAYYLEKVKKPNASLFLNPVNSQELIDICRKLKPKTSCGHDDISTKLLIETISNISIPLAHIFNLSFISGTVPDSMKLAKVIPIFKSGNKKLFNNYRPISLLPAFSKLLEKTVAIRLMSFLENFNILYEHQYGFRKKHSTIHPIMHLLKYISNSSDKPSKDVTLGLFLDLSKAFDTIDHNTLISKLNFYGIRGMANDWFTSYLTNRYQFTEINGVKSTILSLICGVPQGSILGPILFLLYVNDINLSSNMKIVSFADDTTAYMSHHNIDDLCKDTNTELAKMNDWFCANKLALNTKKTKFTILCPKSNNKHLAARTNLTINGTTIERIGHQQQEKYVKFLGINMDDNLSWSNHISILRSKLSRSIFALNRVKNLFPHDVLKSLYFSLIHSHINYGLLAWGNASSVKQIEILQKKAIRIINKKPYNAHTEPLFRKEKILKVTDLFKLQASTFVYDFKHDNLPRSFSDFFPINPNPNPRRLHHIPRNVSMPRTNFSALLPYHNFPVLWNSLDGNIQASKSRNQFNNALKAQIINTYPEHVICSNPFCPDCH